METASSNIRVGVVAPAGNVIHAREFEALRPSGVAFRFAHFPNPAASSPTFRADLTDGLAAPLAALKDWGADIVLLGCTTASMICADDEFRAGLEDAAAAPVVTAAGASRDAIRALGIRSVSVSTPYGDNANRIVVRYLESIGVTVASIKGMALDRAPDIWAAQAPFLTPEQILDFSLSADADDAQAMYMPCTAINSLGALAPYEAKTGKPAFSSVQAGYWAALRRLGVDGRCAGHGKLLERWDF